MPQETRNRIVGRVYDIRPKGEYNHMYAVYVGYFDGDGGGHTFYPLSEVPYIARPDGMVRFGEHFHAYVANKYALKKYFKKLHENGKI